MDELIIIVIGCREVVVPHQVEMRVRWPAWLLKKGKMAPASHKDLLVLVVACMVEVEVKNSTNES